MLISADDQLRLVDKSPFARRRTVYHQQHGHFRKHRNSSLRCLDKMLILR
jgi:hypothetical protein